MRFTTFLVKNLLRRKIRSALTCLGFAVAVGTTVALLGLSDGFERSWTASMIERDIGIVVMAEGVLDQLSSELDAAHRERLAALPGVKEAAPALIEMTEFRDRNVVLSLIVQGWELDSVLFTGIEVLEGRALEPGDERAAVLGKTLAGNIERGVGDTITLQGETFEIVGITESFVVYENGAVTVPLAELQRLMRREGKVTAFSLVLDESVVSEDEVDAVSAEINALTDDDGRSLRLSAMATRDFVNNAMHIRVIHAMAWVTSAIAVVVGSIGVLNTMIMSVVERVKEISILRAIGWRKSRVMRMVLGEALMLSLVGAVLGNLGAVLLVGWLTTLPAAAGFVQGEIALAVILKGFALAGIVGLLGGAWPAWRAARLLPSEGLRYE